MKIEQANVTMQACHDFSCEYEADFKFESDFKTVFDKVSQTSEATQPNKDDSRLKLLLMLEALIARILDVISGKANAEATDVQEILKTGGKNDKQPEAIPADDFAGGNKIHWQSEFTESYHEEETSEFQSSGVIQTADGRTLDFKLDLCMSREFACERKATEQGTVVLRDPLVINFDGKSAELSGKRFSFDLDVDGKSESMFGLGASSGYLAIDSNNDGLINDGSELFGTRSGDGFADLAKFDSDGNHWLDEADSQFDRLRIWQQDAAGGNVLSSLRDKGIGALYLGSVETPFTLADKENNTLGKVRASGIYLRENGQVGSLQQIDLAV